LSGVRNANVASFAAGHELEQHSSRPAGPAASTHAAAPGRTALCCRDASSASVCAARGFDRLSPNGGKGFDRLSPNGGEGFDKLCPNGGEGFDRLCLNGGEGFDKLSPNGLWMKGRFLAI
jgi:hypothetical protein